MIVIKNLKVMLVDDEDIVIRDMLDLIDWESFGYKVVACANDSEKAMELFLKYLPDIIFVDIRIPKVSGLEFSRQVLSIKSNTKIHILTAYKDFDYAKTAIDIGVVSYQLKHTINKENLLAILEKTRELIGLDEEKTQNLKRQLILKTIGEGYTGTGSRLFTENDFIKNYGNNLALFYLKQDRPYPLVLPEQRDQRLNMSEPYFDQELLPSEVTLVDELEVKPGSILIIFGFANVFGQKEIYEDLCRISQTLKNSMLEKWGCSFSVAYLNHCVQFTDLERSYSFLEETIGYSIFYGKGAIIVADLIKSESKPCQEVNSRLTELYSQRHNWGCSRIVQVIEEVFNTVINARNISEFNNICHKLNILLTLLYEEILLWNFEMCHKKWLTESGCWLSADSIQKWYMKEFQSVLSVSERFGKPSALIQNVLKYIHENYMNSINPNDIAVIFGMNGTYLGQKFKKETGRTFLEYLTNYRIEVAKLLLKSGKYKVYEVSEKVGYKTSQYFSSVFKDVTGITPLDFR